MGGRLGWGPGWHHDLDHRGCQHHWRDFTPAGQDEAFRVHLCATSPGVVEWKVARRPRPPNSLGLIGEGVARTLELAELIAYRVAEAAPRLGARA